LNRVGTVRFTARVVIAPSKAAGAAADGRAAAAGAAARGVVAATATGIAGGTENLLLAIRLNGKLLQKPLGMCL
jgi:hypothetical protein